MFSYHSGRVDRNAITVSLCNHVFDLTVFGFLLISPIFDRQEKKRHVNLLFNQFLDRTDAHANSLCVQFQMFIT